MLTVTVENETVLSIIHELIFTDPVVNDETTIVCTVLWTISEASSKHSNCPLLYLLNKCLPD